MCKDKNKDKKIEKDQIDEFDDFMDNEFLDSIEAEEKRKKGEMSQEEFDKLEFIKKSRANVISGDT
ncbi:MAG: hypothetical protein PF638_14670 [Candidatus Delongbacteria bacterium]|jgi:hypothetical protein|nr:hypothetical protein [Candidatus Delongbacteria bacterium]